jgi:hypothetical protein
VAPGTPVGWGAGGREVEGAEVGFGHAAVETDGLIGHGWGQGDGVVGLDEAEVAGGGGDAVWQRSRRDRRGAQTYPPRPLLITA